MHLALLISSLKPGGAERTASELANYWVNQGYNVTLITLSSSDEKPFYPLHSHIQLIPLDQTSLEISPLFLRLKRIVQRISCIRKTLKIFKPDRIIAFVDIMNITTLLASQGLKIPVIVSERTHPAYYKLPKLYTWLRWFTYGWAFKVIVQTRSAADYFPKRLQSRIAIIPNAVKNPPQRKLLSANLKPVEKIYSVGRLCPDKGFDVLVQVFSGVISDYPQLELTIYGEGKERKNLETLIAKLNLQEKVHLPGITSTIYDVLTQADLFVFPSRYEGFPNALCEAMSIGLPVIASNCSGTIDVIRDGLDGRLFPVGDSKALEELLVELLNDPIQRLNLSRQALKVTERFCEHMVYKLWDDLIAFEGI